MGDQQAKDGRSNELTARHDALREAQDELNTGHISMIEAVTEMANLRKLLANKQRDVETLTEHLKGSPLANQEWADYCQDLKVCICLSRALTEPPDILSARQSAQDIVCAHQCVRTTGAYRIGVLRTHKSCGPSF